MLMMVPPLMSLVWNEGPAFPNRDIDGAGAVWDSWAVRYEFIVDRDSKDMLECMVHAILDGNHRVVYMCS